MKVKFIRVPYYFGDLYMDPDFENCPYRGLNSSNRVPVRFPSQAVCAFLALSGHLTIPTIGFWGIYGD